VAASAAVASVVVGLPVSAGASPLPDAPDCPMLPADNVWHADISQLPVHPRSAQYVTSMGLGTAVHADFGSGLWNGGAIGIPYVTVPGDQPRVGVSFTYADESDPGPYPIPSDAPIEGGPGSRGDRHVLVVDRDACVLYEVFAAYPRPNGSWKAGSGAGFALDSNDLRPATWTSADAAGLAIFPGLVRYEEANGTAEIGHAFRVTVRATNGYVWPASHNAGSTAGALPMGARLRLKASKNLSSFTPDVQRMFRAMQRYGLIVADNGTDLYVTGTLDARWNNSVLNPAFQALSAADFDVVQLGGRGVPPQPPANVRVIR